MQLDFSVLTEKELKIRRWWKLLFMTFSGAIISLLTIGSIINTVSAENAVFVAGESLAAILCICVPLFIIYHCAYKKAGTALLSLFLAVHGIKILILGFAICLVAFPLNLIPFLFLLMLMFFFMMNWKLRKINKKLQSVVYPQEYLAERQLLTNTLSQTELDCSYSALIQKWPQFECHSTRLYKQHLQILSREQCISPKFDET